MGENFYRQLKSQFKNKKLSMTVVEGMDETDNLLTCPANAERLLKAIANANKGGGLVTVDMDKLSQSIAE